MRRFTIRVGTAVMTVAAIVAATLLANSASAPAQSAAPGTVVAVDPLPREQWLHGAVDASRVTYWSTGPLNQPALSTGAVFVPPGEPPPGGWPVVSWAHGTVGIADKCAPTVTGRIGGAYVTHWFSQGYAVVATDYVGLGTPGIHPYLDGRTAAHSVIDMVRAARAVEPTLSPTWVTIGQSQGGQAALLTASLATRYAPELDYRGAVATGGPSNIENLAPLAGPNFPQLPLTGTTTFIAFALAGLRATRPDIDVDAYLSPLGREILDRVEVQCYEEAEPQLVGVSIGQLLSRPLDDPTILGAIRETLGVPVSGYDRPLFIGQGLLDTMVPAPFALKLAADLAANNQRFTFRTYPTSHLGTMPASLPETTIFVRDLFTR